MNDKRIPISEHLVELRARIIVCIVATLLAMIVAYVYCPDVFYPMMRAPLDAIQGDEATNPFVVKHPLLRRLAGHYEAIPDERLYGWIREESIRASWGSTVQWGGNQTTKVEVEQVCKALEACDVNLFWDISNCQAVAGTGFSEAERAAVLERWEWTSAALDGSSVRWYPTLDYRFFRDERTRCFGAQGQELEAPSPMDLEFWRRGWRDPLCAIADFSLTHPGVGGIAIDVELYAHPPAFNYYMGYGFEDACYTFVLDRWAGWVGGSLLDEAAGLGLTERFDWLRTHGLLE